MFYMSHPSSSRDLSNFLGLLTTSQSDLDTVKYFAGVWLMGEDRKVKRAHWTMTNWLSFAEFKPLIGSY